MARWDAAMPKSSFKPGIWRTSCGSSLSVAGATHRNSRMSTDASSAETTRNKINGSATESVVISLRLQGPNSEYYEGHPVDFNLNVDAHLGDLIRAESAIVEIPSVIEDRLRKFAERGR